jgi:hypothetical protein
MREYNLSDGENPTTIQYTHELPTEYPLNTADFDSASGATGMEPIRKSLHPDDWGSATVDGDSTGESSLQDTVGNLVTKQGTAGSGFTPGSPVDGGTDSTDMTTSAGGPASHLINRGQLERSFEIRQVSFKTNTVCLTDLKRAHQAAEAVGAFEKALREYINVFYGDYYRVQNIGMVSSKYTTTSATAGEMIDDDYNQDWSGLSATPSDPLSWAHLNEIYFDLARRGIAEEYAIGTANGRPVLPLIASPELIQSLWRDVSTGTQAGGPSKVETVKFYDPKSNLALLGYDGAINGFLPIVDVFPIRSTGLASSTFVYPTANEQTSFGRRYVKNSNYADADYEAATILPSRVYECLYEPSTPTAFSGMNFDPQNYVGEFRWVNNQTFEGHNDRGNLGYYMCDIRIGCKPVNPDLGISIIAAKA